MAMFVSMLMSMTLMPVSVGMAMEIGMISSVMLSSRTMAMIMFEAMMPMMCLYRCGKDGQSD